MRVIWKDSNSRGTKPVRYRKYTATGYEYGDGWVIDIPGDNNIYYSHYCALNAIDEYLGGYNKNGGSEKRRSCGIKIIGDKNEIA